MSPRRFVLGSTLEDTLSIINRKTALSGLALIGVSTLLLAGCAAAPTKSPTKTATNKFLPCMVSDNGGFDDHSFNELGLDGLKAAAKKLNSKYKAVESNADTDYAPNIQSLIDQKCDLIITVGFNLSAASLKAAAANPNIKFAIIDDAADADFNGKVDDPNIKPILFDTAQAAFMAGYAAASYSKSHVVGTFGGMNFPTVSIFMTGYADGVKYFNQQKGADVKVIGLKTFTGGFAANNTAKSIAANEINQGADVLLPVGGPIFQSAGAAIKDSGKDVVMLGVDADVYTTFPTYDDLYLTSVLKGISQATQDVVTDVEGGNFNNTPYVGTLKNNGVGIAPFHNYASKVDSGLQGELDAIKKSIISGDIVVKSYLNAG
jgi:basic membrane protein A